MVVYAPLIIGITGKRDLQGKDAAVGKAFRELFELLDRTFSHTPKILVSALARGADTIAAEEALAHAERQRTAGPPACTWQVVAVLPMPIEQYAEDFDPEGAAKLRKLCAQMRTEVLDPLLRPEAGSPFALGTPFAWTELARGNGSPHRTAHYEQVGLHISDQCGLLIAVMPRGERPDKIGGSARIVDYRVRAEIDDPRRDIIRRSQVLAPLPLDRPQPGPAWVIDLGALDAAKETQLNAVELWEPVAREEHEETRDANHAGESGNHPAGKNHLAEAGNHPVEIRKTRLTSFWHDFDRLWLATAIETFNAKVSRISSEEWQQQVEKRTRPDVGDASSKLRRLRLALSFVQGREKRRLTNTAVTLATLFVVAIVALEVHIEFESAGAIAFYVLFFMIILGLYGYARWRRYQQHTEDYRAVSEALRVQLG